MRCNNYVHWKLTGKKVLGVGDASGIIPVDSETADYDVNSPISVMETAGEGGAWGIALLASYLNVKNGLSLADWLEKVVFAGNTGTSVNPDPADVEGFNKYMSVYMDGLPVERAAIECKKLS